MNTPLHILAQGLRTERVEQHIELARWSTGNALLVGGLLTLVGLYAVVWFYRRESRGKVTARMRWAMVTCRVLVLVLLGLIGLEPVVVNYVHRRMDALTLVLVDDSASMSLPDHYRFPEDAERAGRVAGDVSAGIVRTELAERVIGKDHRRMLTELARKNPVRLFTFSDHLTSLGMIGGPPEMAASQPSAHAAESLGLDPRGAATDVGRAIRGALDSMGGAPAAAIVLLTDGGFNQGESPDVIARVLKGKDAPLHIVGVGDPAPPVNAAITEIAAPRYAFKNDPFSVTVRVAADGIEDRPIQVELLEGAAGSRDAPKSVGTKEIRPDADGRFPPAVFDRKVSAAGQVNYIARIAPLEFESITTDNQRQTIPPVQVLNDKMRVLLVAGSPTYDYRYLIRMMERDASVDVAAWLQSADVRAVRDGDTVLTELPSQPEELFKYDAIILIDVDPDDFEPTWGSLVATFVVDHGGGLLYQAGNKYTARFLRSPKTSTIVEMLPIVPDPDAEIILNDLGQYQTRPWPIQFSDQALLDPILRQSDNPAENRAIWSALDGAYWHYPVRREKPVAAALMTHSDPRMIGPFGPHVLLATQFVGAGRTAWLGINSTWRWRRGDEKHFNRFWIQMLRYLVEGKLLGGRSRGQITTSKDEYDLGDTVVVTVRALDEAFNPLPLPELELVIAPQKNDEADQGESNEPSRRVALAPTPGREGYFQGRFVADRPGMHQLTIDLPGGSGAAAPARLEKAISVVQPNIEMRDTAMKREALQQFAAAAGGKYFDIDETDKIAEVVQDRSRTIVTRERPRALWDNRYTLAALLILLTIEWILRKYARLL